VVALRPARFQVSRSAVIAGPPATVFPHVNELPKWKAWSPWQRLDPDAKNTFSGPESGVGSSMAWEGNNQVGSGRMTVTESATDNRVVFRLDFEKPFRATHTAEFTFAPEGAGTRVTWTMTGNNGFMGKLVSLFMNCDKMIGAQFEAGLANLDEVVRSGRS
jgi:uncharacterized protein YndB with AHSA1/START domain